MPVIAHPFRSHRQAKGLVPRRGEREARRRVTEDVRRVRTAKRLARPEGLEPSTPGLEGGRRHGVERKCRGLILIASG
jgi:hypothetical protein